MWENMRWMWAPFTDLMWVSCSVSVNGCVFEGSSCVDLSFPGTDVCSTCGVVTLEFYFPDFLPWVGPKRPRPPLPLVDCCWRRPGSRCSTGRITDANTWRSILISFGSVSHRRWLALHHRVSSGCRKDGSSKCDCTEGGKTEGSSSFDSHGHFDGQVLYDGHVGVVETRQRRLAREVSALPYFVPCAAWTRPVDAANAEIALPCTTSNR